MPTVTTSTCRALLLLAAFGLPVASPSAADTLKVWLVAGDRVHILVARGDGDTVVPGRFDGEVSVLEWRVGDPRATRREYAPLPCAATGVVAAVTSPEEVCAAVHRAFPNAPGGPFGRVRLVETPRGTVLSRVSQDSFEVEAFLRTGGGLASLPRFVTANGEVYSEPREDGIAGLPAPLLFAGFRHARRSRAAGTFVAVEGESARSGLLWCARWPDEPCAAVRETASAGSFRPLRLDGAGSSALSLWTRQSSASTEVVGIDSTTGTLGLRAVLPASGTPVRTSSGQVVVVGTDPACENGSCRFEAWILRSASEAAATVTVEFPRR